MKALEVRDLVKNYGDVKAVKGVSLEIEKGEVFGFLGPNGAGKSTTIKILSTLLKPDGGKAYLAGYDVETQPGLVRSSIGIVFQDPSLDENLTAAENLYFHAIIYGMEKKKRGERIKKVLEMVELWERKDELVKHYSGGMKRRLEIARGLLHYPQVLFLDEPTVGLDPQTRSHIWSYIHELRVKEEITIFLTTHYMDEAENCNRISIMDHGRIIATGTPEQLKKRVGGDVITVQAENNNELKKILEADYGLEVNEKGGKLSFKVYEGEKFIPGLLAGLQVSLKCISLRKPTLDDVFLKLTGRAIREEGVSARDQMRNHMRMSRGR